MGDKFRHAKKLIENRIGCLESFIKWEEKHLDEQLKNCEDTSSRIKAMIAELKELNQALKA